MNAVFEPRIRKSPKISEKNKKRRKERKTRQDKTPSTKGRKSRGEAPFQTETKKTRLTQSGDPEKISDAANYL